MALTYTPTDGLRSPMPRFELPSVDGQVFRPEQFADKDVLVVMFICNHCPYVKAIEDRLIDLAHRLHGTRAQVIGICANDPTDYPEDAPQALLERWRSKNYGFPYLIDATQDVAKAFGAVCTPDFFVYDRERRLRYRGRLDDSWRDPNKVSQRELELAVEALLAGRPVSEQQKPSMGCSIKWRSPKPEARHK
jgi:peroxiredoxin